MDVPSLADEEDADSAEVSGVIVDGYVEGAHVFLDLNGNQELDDDEPSATSDAKGAFKLRIALFNRERFAAAFLQAEIPESAKDSDDMGRTLREAGKKGFTLLSPASVLLDEKVEGSEPLPKDREGKPATDKPVRPAVLSPLSTLVVGEMIERGIPLAEAKAAVQSALGLAGKELLHDFVANPDAVLHNVARAAAVGLGEAMRVKGSDADAGVMPRPGAQVVDAVRSVKEQLPQVIDALDLRKDTPMTATVERVKAELAEQQQRTSDARATASDAGVRMADSIGAKPPAVDGSAAGANGGVRLPDGMLPPASTSGAPLAADAGVRLPEPKEALPMQPPMLKPVDGSGTGVRMLEPKPADAGVRTDAAQPTEPARPGSLSSDGSVPVYPTADAGVAIRK